jgi:hypothetical protein
MPNCYQILHWRKSLEFSIACVMSMQSFMDRLNKMSIFNIIKHHHNTIDFYFCNVWYSENIIMRYFTHTHTQSHNVWCCEHISSIQDVLSFLCTFVMYTIWHFKLNRPFSWKISIVRHLRLKCHITKNMTFGRYDTLLHGQMWLYKKGEQHCKMAKD